MPTKPSRTMSQKLRARPTSRWLKAILASFSIIRHDLGNRLTLAGMAVERATDVMDEWGSSRNPEDLKELGANLRRARIALESASASLSRLLPKRASSLPRLSLVCVPARVVDRIVSENRGGRIKIVPPRGRSRVLFPEELLYVVIGELVGNAQKAAGRSGGVAVKAIVRNSKLTIEVHDDGPGFPNASDKSMVPLDSALGNVNGASGLSELTRFVYLIDGTVGFGRSSILKGAIVRVLIPVDRV